MRATARQAHALTRASAQTFPAAKRSLRADNRHRCGAAQRRFRFSGVRSEAVCGRRSCRWPRLPSDHSSYVRRPAAGRHCFPLRAPQSHLRNGCREHVFARTHPVPASCRHYRPLVILEAQPGRAPPLCHSPSSFADLPQWLGSLQLVPEQSCAVFPTEDCETVRGDSTHLKACDPLPERRVFANVHTVGKHLSRAPCLWPRMNRRCRIVRAVRCAVSAGAARVWRLSAQRRRV